MTQKLKPLSSKPPLNKEFTDQLQQFVQQANDPDRSGTLYTISNTTSVRKRELFPWEEPHIRDDLKKSFLLRITEKDFKKLEYLASVKRDSMHKIVMDILIPEINKQLNIK